MPNIPENINSLSERIAQAAQKSHRATADITLLAVSKGHPAAAVLAAYQCGLRHFGESYLQESLHKLDVLSTQSDISWHFIGPLQSNKTRKVAERFDWVHTIDRIKIAQRLSDQRPAQKPPLNVCLQVNIDDESSKAGIPAAAVPELATVVAQLPGLCLRGLMTIPRPTTAISQQRQAFARTAALLDELRQQADSFSTLDTLSMGMSDDLEAAIIEGATIVRVGTGIFGSRQSMAKSAP